MATQLACEKDIDRAKGRYVAAGRPLSMLNMVVDARLHGVQSKDVVDRLSIYSIALAQEIGRTAVLIDGALHRLQGKRVAQEGNSQIFSDENEALSWINENS